VINSCKSTQLLIRNKKECYFFLDIVEEHSGQFASFLCILRLFAMAEGWETKATNGDERNWRVNGSLGEGAVHSAHSQRPGWGGHMQWASPISYSFSSVRSNNIEIFSEMTASTPISYLSSEAGWKIPVESGTLVSGVC
jgi:hypothetical protein